MQISTGKKQNKQRKTKKTLKKKNPNQAKQKQTKQNEIFPKEVLSSPCKSLVKEPQIPL